MVRGLLIAQTGFMPGRLLIMGLVAAGVGVFGWSGALSLSREGKGDGPGYGQALGAAYSIYAALPMIAAGLAWYATHNSVVTWAVAIAAAVANIPLHRAALRRWPRLQLQHLPHEQVWEIRWSHKRGPVFWATVVLGLVVVVFGVIWAAA